MRFLSLIAALCILSFGAYADVLLTIDNTATTAEYQQQTNRPCIYGYGPCGAPPAGFPAYTNISIGGSETIVDAGTLTQPHPASNGAPVLFNATAAQLTGVAGNAIWLGVDVNENNNTSINILQFEIEDTTTSTMLAHLAPGTVLAAFTNGTGYSDAILKGLDLTGIAGTDNIQFRLQYNDASDGTEQFFAIAGPTAIPEPASILLLGSLLAGFATYLRKR